MWGVRALCECENYASKYGTPVYCQFIMLHHINKQVILTSFVSSLCTILLA